MSKSKQHADTLEQSMKVISSLRQRVQLSRQRMPLWLMVVVLSLVPSVACRRDMQDQPRMNSYRSSSFYADGLGMRQPIEGTVPRGFLKANSEFFTGKKKGTATSGAKPVAAPSPTAGNSNSNALGAAAFPDDIDYIPMKVDEALIERGRQRYGIFCSECHGLTGYGDGMIVRRGFRRAASFHDDRLIQAPAGHFFDVVTNGWGVMPSYASQIPAQDRWAIISYIRALQLTRPPQAQGTPNADNASPQASPAVTGGNQR